MPQLADFGTYGASLLAVMLASGSALSAGKAYIPVTEPGRYLASSESPSAGRVPDIMPLLAASDEKTTKAQEEVRRIQQKADQMAAERKQREQERSAAKDQAKRSKAACESSKSRLQQLESQPPNRRLVVSPDGKADRVSTDEMDQLLSAARQQVKTDCGR